MPASCDFLKNPQDCLPTGSLNSSGGLGTGKIFWGGSDLETFFQLILRWTITVVALAAFFGIIYSGYMMITSNGDAAKFAAGRKNLLWSVVGVVVVVLAYVVVRFGYNLANSL